MYKIISTRPMTYLDRMSQPINGFEVRFEIISTREHHVILVPRMEATLIDSEIKAFIAEREKLEKLGKA